MKKLTFLFLFTTILCSCGNKEDLNTCKGSIVVGKATSFERNGNSTLVVRHKGKLIEITVTRYESECYQLGDTIK